jgi:hypothetical protein
MRLLLALLLCAGSAIAARAEEGAAALSGITSAALEALRGHPKQARAMLAQGKGDPADPAALVVLASMALDEGNTREAARLVVRLRAVVAGAPEGRLLDALVKERVARPQGDWISAGLNAVEAVQPLPAAEPLVAVGERIMEDMLYGRYLPFPEGAASKLSAPDRFLARWAWPQPAGKNEGLIREALRLAASDERPLVLFAALEVLASAEPTAAEGMREADILTARRAAREKLRGTPARLVAWQPGTETQPVGEDEVAAIEALVGQDAPPSFASNYIDLLRILEKLDPAMGPLFAQAAAFRLTMPPTSFATIVDRVARGGLSETARDRLATAFMRLAERQRREGLLITDMFAASYLGNAAMLRKDPALRSRAEEVMSEARALADSMRCLSPLARLPIRSIQGAWAEQKPHEREVARQVARRGLSCPEPKLHPKNVEEPAQRDSSKACPDPGAATSVAPE